MNCSVGLIESSRITETFFFLIFSPATQQLVFADIFVESLNCVSCQRQLLLLTSNQRRSQNLVSGTDVNTMAKTSGTNNRIIRLRSDFILD